MCISWDDLKSENIDYVKFTNCPRTFGGHCIYKIAKRHTLDLILAPACLPPDTHVAVLLEDEQLTGLLPGD